MTARGPITKQPRKVFACALMVVLLSALGSVGKAATIRNTAYGTGALQNTSGAYNSAFGFNALLSDATGNNNTASGYSALSANIDGNNNSAYGFQVLMSNTSGFDNTGFGLNTLLNNTVGHDNNATGLGALRDNSSGNLNTAIGSYSLFSNTTGSLNLAAGAEALSNVTTGGNNIGLGVNAGKNVVAGSHNIEIGGAGTADESDTIRIGANGTQKATYIAGISSTGITGSSVEVDSNGQLGVVTSAARYKRNIRGMADASAGLMRLRPVTFYYKNDRSGMLQYGLVAEEVERVYPELVTRGSDGKLQSIRYLELTAMLLNELQKQSRDAQWQTVQIKKLSEQHRKLGAQLAEAGTAHANEVYAMQAAFERRVFALERAVRCERETARPTLSGFNR